MSSSLGTVVVAVGGNSLITDKDHTSLADQAVAAAQSMTHVADMVAGGWNVVITHGNGPQVGFLLRRAELASAELPTIPLDVLGADTQGATGYMFSKALHEEFAKRGVAKQAIAIVTQTVVDENDPAFGSPSKPIGSFMSEADASERASHDGWQVVEDSGRGWRRVVASPKPKRIVEIDAIRALNAAGFAVIAAGGGGIPVVEDGQTLRGIEAVIDKDFATALLANELDADILLISTAVDAVAVDFNKPTQRWLGEVSVAEMRQHLQDGQFGAGSMAPKIEAALAFIERGGKRVIITSPERMADAVAGTAGTTIIP
ncbi:MAG TPA: carbamate kinase [Propionibacteriaceae bacterium]|nr:carbamate kinase [Propionibacteriaceae bacterium]HBY22182.1 carbamate kinase [Propionibacteriaceae bacterium]